MIEMSFVHFENGGFLAIYLSKNFVGAPLGCVLERASAQPSHSRVLEGRIPQAYIATIAIFRLVERLDRLAATFQKQITTPITRA